jgi:hypothetical protein
MKNNLSFSGKMVLYVLIYLSFYPVAVFSQNYNELRPDITNVAWKLGTIMGALAGAYFLFKIFKEAWRQKKQQKAQSLQTSINEHLITLSDSKAKVEYLLEVFQKHKNFSIRKNALDKLANMGKQAMYAVQSLKEFLKASSVKPAIKVWMHRTLILIEGSADIHCKAIADILDEYAAFLTEGRTDDWTTLTEAVDAIVSLGERGFSTLLSIASDTKYHVTARVTSIGALSERMSQIKDLSLRENIISFWIDATDDKRVRSVARRALTSVCGSDLGKSKDKWAQWWQANKTVMMNKWQSTDNPKT